MYAKKKTDTKPKELTLEILQRLRKNKIKVAALYQEISHGFYCDGLHGLRYDRERVTGGNKRRDLSDIVLEGEKEREYLIKEYFSTMEAIAAARLILYNAIDKALGQNTKDGLYLTIILLYYSQGRAVMEISREIGRSRSQTFQLKNEAISKLLGL